MDHTTEKTVGRASELKTEMKRVREKEEKSQAPAASMDTDASDAIPEPSAARVRKRKRPTKTPAVDSVAIGDSSAGVAAPAPVLGAASTVYVEGISYSASEEDVKKVFEACGPVLDVRMPRYQDSNRPRGYAHVDFGTATDAATALKKMAGFSLMGRYLNVQKCNAPKGGASADMPRTHKPRPAGCKTVFVRNLPYDCSEDAVRQTFSACGKVAEVRIAVHNNTKLRKGFGYVDFVKETSSETAVNKSDLLVGGRLVQCDYEVGKPKGSFKLESGKHYVSKEKPKVKAPSKPRL